MLAVSIALPLLAGALLPALPFRRPTARNAYVLAMTVLTSLLLAWGLMQPANGTLDLLRFNDRLTLSLRADGLGRLFAVLVAVLWPITTLYAIEYMRDDARQNSFFAFFLMSYGVTLGIALSANLLTLYLFYELLSLSTLPLVMHGGSGRAVQAGLKYLYYSLGGAAFAFIGLVYLVYFGGTTDFVYGGLFAHVDIVHTSQLRLGYLLCFLGFGVKAAVFPLHSWLPAASVAPTPVTALLHAVAVVKSGVFAIIRITYFSFGAALLRGSYAQHIPLILASFTIVYGCAMAFREHNLKRRLAYSTVSNLSYILYGALLLTPQGLSAGLMHLVFHALMKILLFLAAGVYMVKAQADDVRDLRGLGHSMALTSGVFVLGSLSMTGIPPLIGFLSKWSLGVAGVTLGGLLPAVGVVALLISAVLTGIYLMMPSITLYTARRAEDASAPEPLGLPMRLTLASLALAIVMLSFYNEPLLAFLARTASGQI